MTKSLLPNYIENRFCHAQVLFRRLDVYSEYKTQMEYISHLLKQLYIKKCLIEPTESTNIYIAMSFIFIRQMK